MPTLEDLGRDPDLEASLTLMQSSGTLWDGPKGGVESYVDGKQPDGATDEEVNSFLENLMAEG